MFTAKMSGTPLLNGLSRKCSNSGLFPQQRQGCVTTGPTGILSAAMPAVDEPADSYIYDPKDPAPCGTRFDRVVKFEGDMQSYPYDYKDIDSRHMS